MSNRILFRRRLVRAHRTSTGTRCPLDLASLMSRVRSEQSSASGQGNVRSVVSRHVVAQLKGPVPQTIPCWPVLDLQVVEVGQDVLRSRGCEMPAEGQPAESRHDLELMVISHDLVLVAAHTGDVLALRDGRVLASGTTTRVLAG
jgi:ABC-type hemin transport system ATPase subunit